jgi:hypothetical protein
MKTELILWLLALAGLYVAVHQLIYNLSLGGQ